ncbi:hypothetical protein [Methylocapsa palsarum]|uniref:Uncharacterized protein n=1 Tax=Methylocapsa palsarum TaxID=1612308 RepID=A0A1I4BSR3_9HYPH|nr:hypothetical protein [Methylocapsa palsarum]SFK71573.1 hypothetical protein SAMN05444581_11651 [Methylocapsa palsarum]
MKPIQVIDKARSRYKTDARLAPLPVSSLPAASGVAKPSGPKDSDARYRLTRVRTAIHIITERLPPAWREWAAEFYLRRRDAPGPAAEHVFQYLLGAAKWRRKSAPQNEGSIAKGADRFYERQYRQYLNPTMGAFAMTATRVLLAAGGAPQGLLWRRRRKTGAAMLEETEAGAPILVISREIVAVPIALPCLETHDECAAAMRWLRGYGATPRRYRELIDGQALNCVEPNVRACEQTRDGALLMVLGNVLKRKKLALLALHPCDPDAMGLHITLFGTQILEPKRLAREYGLPAGALATYEAAALRQGSLLMFCVGATEEVFTQCSQNLFFKHPLADDDSRKKAIAPQAWSPSLPLERLLEAQFETFQITVSASGLPGASPRNGDRGEAAFVTRRSGKTFILIPYYPGNFVHGHAAKLWSNQYGSLMIYDDHTARTAVTINGPSRVLWRETVERDFPDIASRSAATPGRSGDPTPSPEYWYLQEAAELAQQTEPLAAHALDPQRPTCSISAGGHAKHDKKPTYFATISEKPYDVARQHEREAAGRPRDPAGFEHRQWAHAVQSCLEQRRAHLNACLGAGAFNPAPPPAHPAR